MLLIIALIASNIYVIRCPEILAPDNGSIKGDKFYRNQVVDFTCNEGFNLRGSQRRRCNATGHWTGTETYCMDNTNRPCIVPNFENQPVIILSAGTIVDRHQQRMLQHGTEIEFQCANQRTHTLISESTSTCSNASWSHTKNPKCVINCPVLSAPSNGIMIGDKFYQQQELLFSCNDGYRRSGSRRRVCTGSGKWSGREAFCIPIDGSCDDPGDILNGKRSGNSFNTWDSLTYECNTGHRLIGSTTLICFPGNQWSSDVPSCEMERANGECKVPLIENAYVRVYDNVYGGNIPSVGNVVAVGSTLVITCRAGYVMSSNGGTTSFVSCTDSGWSKEILLCVYDDNMAELR